MMGEQRVILGREAEFFRDRVATLTTVRQHLIDAASLLASEADMYGRASDEAIAAATSGPVETVIANNFPNNATSARTLADAAFSTIDDISTMIRATEDARIAMLHLKSTLWNLPPLE